MSGSGTYVAVNEGSQHASPYAPRMLVEERFDKTLQLAEKMHVKVKAALDDIASLAANVSLPTDWSSVLGNVAISEIAKLPLPEAPDWDSLSLPDDWPSDFPLAPVFKAIPQIDSSIDEPDLPEESSPTINYKEERYNSDLWVTLYSKTLEELEKGSTGLAADVEQAIYDRAKLRAQADNQALYDKMMRAVAQSGFDMPGGSVVAVSQEMNKTIMRQQAEINQTIIIQQGELAQKNSHFVREQARTMEQIARDFHNGRQQRSLEAEKAAAQLVLQVYSEKIKTYLAQWDGRKAKIEMQVAILQAAVAENNALLEKFKAENEGVIAQIEGIAKKSDAIVGAHKSKTDAYASQVKAQGAWYGVLTEEQKTKLGVADLKLRKAMAEVDARIRSALSTNELRRQISADVANIANQAMASALNAVNASAGVSYSGSESLSESWGHSDSITESHSFDETTTG